MERRLGNTKRMSITIEQRNKIVRDNINLARKIAHRMRGCTVEEYCDVEQIAIMGLMRAAEKYDPSQGYRFSSYAVPHIRGAIMHWIRDRGNSIKVPRRWRENYSSGIKWRNTNTVNGVIPSDEQVAAFLGITPEEWRQQAIACEARTVALPEPGEGVEPSYEENLTEEETDVASTIKPLIDKLYDGLSRLPHKQRELVEYAYIKRGQLGAFEKGKTAEEIQSELQSALSMLKDIVEGKVYRPSVTQLTLF